MNDYTFTFTLIQGVLAAGENFGVGVAAFASYDEHDKYSDGNPDAIDFYVDRLRIARMQRVDASTYELIYKPANPMFAGSDEMLSESERNNIARVCDELMGCKVVESDTTIYVD